MTAVHSGIGDTRPANIQGLAIASLRPGKDRLSTASVSSRRLPAVQAKSSKRRPQGPELRQYCPCRQRQIEVRGDGGALQENQTPGVIGCDRITFRNGEKYLMNIRWRLMGKQKSQSLGDEACLFMKLAGSRGNGQFLAIDPSSRKQNQVVLVDRAASNGKAEGVSIYLVGSDCKTALDGVVLYQDGKKWKTLVRPKGFTRADGSRVTDYDLKNVMQSAGDGVVTQRSPEGVTVAGQPVKLVCEDHNKLAANARIQDYVIRVLEGKESTIGN